MSGKKLSSKEIKQIILARRAESFLAPYFDKLNTVYVGDGLVLRGTIVFDKKPYQVTIPLNKRLQQAMKLLERIEPAVIGETIKLENVKLLLLLVFSPTRVVAQLCLNYKNRVRKVIGLAHKNQKLLNLAVFQRVTGKKFLKGTLKKGKEMKSAK